MVIAAGVITPQELWLVLSLVLGVLAGVRLPRLVGDLRAAVRARRAAGDGSRALRRAAGDRSDLAPDITGRGVTGSSLSWR